jgi:hypothetical protein
MKTDNHSMKGGKSKGFTKLAAAFAAGAAAGLTVGVLISSEKGSSFRDKIKSFMKEADGSMEEKQEGQAG